MKAKQEVILLAEQLYYNTKIRKAGTGIEYYVSPHYLGEWHNKMGMALRRASCEAAPQLRVLGCDEQLADRVLQDLQVLGLSTKEQVACYLSTLVHGLTNDDVLIQKDCVVVRRNGMNTLRVVGSQKHPEWRSQ